ncbi:MAG: [cytidine(C)-cytidine(C)-adenosine (A)]-adding enzyme, partial [Erysipelotrichaceae bacterium]|nr:[cytidine(C)-cytidine(C)-adenosine (A)]-adding enzyme [Erysipelotrichaceae bacterium]
MKQMLPSYIKTILTILHHAQAEAFLVGGCVRDMILKRPIHDYDIATNLSPSQVQLLFQQKGYTVVSTGIAYGTVSILIHHQIVEVTTYRMETSYQNHRFPSQFHYAKNIEEDLKRRDFTMNAIAYHPQIGYIDPYQGYEDIQKACIRCVGDPHQRFQEDALRILRALRFSCTLSFSIKKDTAKAIQKNTHLLTHISQERIRNEFTKMLQSNAENLFLFLKEFNVLYYIL